MLKYNYAYIYMLILKNIFSDFPANSEYLFSSIQMIFT